jgi:hypothetical protein
MGKIKRRVRHYWKREIITEDTLKISEGNCNEQKNENFKYFRKCFTMGFDDKWNDIFIYYDFIINGGFVGADGKLGNATFVGNIIKDYFRPQIYIPYSIICDLDIYMYKLKTFNIYNIATTSGWNMVHHYLKVLMKLDTDVSYYGFKEETIYKNEKMVVYPLGKIKDLEFYNLESTVGRIIGIVNLVNLKLNILNLIINVKLIDTEFIF